MKHPIQPLHMVNGTLRFKENAIVRFLLDNGPFDLGQLERMDFSENDRAHFAQLIGYSLGGFGGLGYESDKIEKKAEKRWRKKNEISVLSKGRNETHTK